MAGDRRTRNRLFAAIGAGAITLAAGLTPVAAAPQGSPAVNDVTAQTRRYYDALRHNDVAELDAILAPDYTEVSPLGQVDTRTQVIGFCRVAARAQTGQASELSEIALDDVSVRVFGEVAVVSVGASFGMRVAGQPVSRPMRSTLVWHRRGGTWLMVASHHTSVRPPVGPGESSGR